MDSKVWSVFDRLFIRDSVSYNLSGLKRVLVFNQKNFAARLKLNPRNGTEVSMAW